MIIERGSVWNKWDFHVHTPYSVLYNEYGFSLIRGDYSGEEKKFDEYVYKLFTKAIENGIVAIGITDYFSIDGYKRIKECYLSNPNKMQALFPEESLREKVKSIYVFPNIELRIDKFVGDKKHAVNFHVIFSGDVDIVEIEENFLQCLKIIDQNNNELPLTKSSIERIGQDFIKSNNLKNSGNCYSIGMEKITVNDERVLDIFKSNKNFQGLYLISIPVDEDLSSVSWDGRDGPTRIRLYNESDLLMTSNARTRDWALAKGHEEEQIQTFRSIKPCIWGSDAHDYKKMFAPTDNKYCWIKAEPSFEGLLQVLYEPSERVLIQKECPARNKPHQTIDKIIFKSPDFASTPIYFNEGLTAIIGGKSTGKSILLRHVAKSADPRQVKEKEARITPVTDDLSGSNKYEVDADVYWKDGASGERKIIYIPQSWLNRLVDDKRWDSQLNQMLEDILLQQDSIDQASKLHKQNVDNFINTVNHDIVDYVEAINHINSDKKRLKNEGASQQFRHQILNLENDREELSKKLGVTQELLQKYSELGSKIDSLKQQEAVLKQEAARLDFLAQPQPFLYINGLTTIGNSDHNYDFSSFPTVKDILDNTVNKVNIEISRIWNEGYNKAQETIREKLDSVSSELEQLEKDYRPLKEKVALSEQLQNIEKNISEERKKLSKALEIETKIEKNENKANGLKQRILQSRNTLREFYDNFRMKISDACPISDNLKFEAQVDEKRNEIFEAINGLFNKKGFQLFKKAHNNDLQSKEEFVVNDELFDYLWQDVIDEKLQFKAGNDLKMFLEKMFSDWFYIHYVVMSGNDTINNMSPGKKALVLLELIVNLEKGNCPILIDQPEDDLDNRSIYSDLVQYLKAKKHERQIIVVTHNANVVIGADAEEVIIANQAGKESPNNQKRFEYRSGGIESNYPKYDSNGKIADGVLNSKGIQQQICDILEGGKRAFELRKNKYFNVADIF